VEKPLILEEQVLIVPARRKWARSLWVELRPQQWVKNLLVLTPLLFSQNLFAPVAVGRTLATFIFFCFISSSVYLLNDIKDREQDRLHPQKRHRPIAAGELSLMVAQVVMVVLLFLALAGGALISQTLALVLSVYWLINLLYSAWLKNEVILDVFAIASGFVLRVVGGGIAVHVVASHWLFLCTSLLALFLGFSKRRQELVLLGEEAAGHRHVLGEYSIPFLDMMIGIVTASTVMSYALYTVSEETVRRFQTHALLLTLPFVLYGIFRYLYLIYHKDQGGDPAQDLLTDRYIMIDIFLWAILTGIIIYWK